VAARLLALALVAPLWAACTSPCLKVQQVLCQCQGSTQNERNVCEDAASAQEQLAPPDDAQLAACEALLPDCEAQVALGCDALDTPDGRRACGIAVR
jgi:hypothetical protein